jgi:hypothetical protein
MHMSKCLKVIETALRPVKHYITHRKWVLSALFACSLIRTTCLPFHVLTIPSKGWMRTINCTTWVVNTVHRCIYMVTCYSALMPGSSSEEETIKEISRSGRHFRIRRRHLKRRSCCPKSLKQHLRMLEGRRPWTCPMAWCRVLGGEHRQWLPSGSQRLGRRCHLTR